MTGKDKVNGAEQPAAVPHLRRDQCFCAEQKTQTLFIVAPAGLKPGDVGHQPIWQGLSRELRPHSIAWVVDSESRWQAECVVLSNLPGRCAVHVERVIHLPSVDMRGTRALPENIMVSFGGPGVGWLVERKEKDGTLTVMGKGADHPDWRDEETVLRWVLDHATVRQTVGPKRH